jgi:hypothetical protein
MGVARPTTISVVVTNPHLSMVRCELVIIERLPPLPCVSYLAKFYAIFTLSRLLMKRRVPQVGFRRRIGEILL